MRKAFIGASTALLFSMAGCGDSPTETATNVQVPGSEDVQNRLEDMPEAQRNAVFIRAIRDADQECQHVESSQPAGQHEGFPVWNATCVGGGTWTIVIMNDGTAAVLNDAEARLATGDMSGTQNAQGE